MNRNNLMINDWVDYNGKCAIVKSIEPRTLDILVCIDGRDMIVTETYDNIEPILITREFLLKNGFEFVVSGDDFTKAYRLHGTLYKWKDIKKGYYINFIFFYDGYLNKTRCMLQNNYDTMSRVAHISDMLYIHELQHAIIMFGIEKKITLCVYNVSDEIKEIVSETFKGNSDINKETFTFHAMLGAEWRLSHPNESYKSVYDETDLRYPYNTGEGRSYSEALNASAFQYGAEIAYDIMRRKEKTE